MPSKNWIQGAHIKEGALTAQAKAAGMSLDAFCKKKGLSARTKKRCTLMKTLRSFKKK